MARACSVLLVLAASGCRPEHAAAPVREPAETQNITTRSAPPNVKVAVLETAGSGNWAGALALSPAPASLVAPCLAPGATGWVSVDVESRNNDEASTTSIVEASPDTSAETRACIAHALTGVRTKFDAMRFVLYVTFSPAPP